MNNLINIIIIVLSCFNVFAQNQDSTAIELENWIIDTVFIDDVKMKGYAVNSIRYGPIFKRKNDPSFIYVDTESCSCCWSNKCEGRKVRMQGDLINVLIQEESKVGTDEYVVAKLVLINFKIKGICSKKPFIESPDNSCYPDD